MRNKTVILFDGECLLCNSWVQWLIKRDKKEIFSFCPLQTPKGQKIIQQFGAPIAHLDTVILIEEQHAFIKSSAVIRILRRLPYPYKAGFLFISIPRPIRDWCYDFVAQRRFKWWGRKDQCMVPEANQTKRFL